MADIYGFRDHAIIDADAPNSSLQIYLDAAKQYFKGSGVPEPAEPNALYDMGVYQLGAFFYDKRMPLGPDMVKAADAVPFGINGIILQLKEGW